MPSQLLFYFPLVFFVLWISYPPMMNVVQEFSRKRKATNIYIYIFSIDINFNQQLMAISLRLLLNRIESISLWIPFFFFFFFSYFLFVNWEQKKFPVFFFGGVFLDISSVVVVLFVGVSCVHRFGWFPFFSSFYSTENLSRFNDFVFFFSFFFFSPIDLNIPHIIIETFAL